MYRDQSGLSCVDIAVQPDRYVVCTLFLTFSSSGSLVSEFVRLFLLTVCTSQTRYERTQRSFESGLHDVSHSTSSTQCGLTLGQKNHALVLAQDFERDLTCIVNIPYANLTATSASTSTRTHIRVCQLSM